MKGRITATVWKWAGINAAALMAVLLLAYGAGSSSGGLGLRDFGALGQCAEVAQAESSRTRSRAIRQQQHCHQRRGVNACPLPHRRSDASLHLLPPEDCEP